MYDPIRLDTKLFSKVPRRTESATCSNVPNGIPSQGTFGRIFARLDPVQFEACFTEWVQAVNEVIQGQVVAIDGKTIVVHTTGVQVSDPHGERVGIRQSPGSRSDETIIQRDHSDELLRLWTCRAAVTIDGGVRRR